MMKIENNHPHSGHRKRLRNLIDNVGLKSLNDIQIVELILTLTHARCDTNVIAHRLIDKFGSISNILDADISSLTQVDGVGLVTAQTLTYLPQIFNIYIDNSSGIDVTINSIKYAFDNAKANALATYGRNGFFESIGSFFNLLINYRNLALAFLLGIGVFKFKKHPIIYIVIAAVFGIIFNMYEVTYI